MSNPPLTLKLKIGGVGFGSAKSPPLTTPTPSSATPKIRFGPSKPNTPSEPLPTPKTKAGRIPKPSPKVVANKNGKRKGGDSDDEDGGTIVYAKKTQANIQPAPKKLRMSLGGPKTPATPMFVRPKFKGKPPKRPLGDGYDSEASDRELDPVIEEEFILRMLPGPDCDYLRQMIAEKRIGLPRKEGGADVQMKFLHPEGRRAIVTVRGNHYAATIADLPTIIEGMKSWDKKGWYKSADICQMLWVFKRIVMEGEAMTVDLPRDIDEKTHQYPHGLTAPMHDARKRRFRKRISRTAIEAVEDAVEKLLEADARAESTRYEMIDPEGSRQGSRAYSTASPGARFGGGEYSENEEDDAEGEDDDTQDYFSYVNGNRHTQPDIRDLEDETADLEADLEAAFDEAEMDVGTPSSQAIVGTPDILLANGGTPDASGVQEDSGDDSSGAEDEDEDAEGEDDGEVDENERARLAQLQGAKEDIVDMERNLASQQAQLAQQANPILQKRIRDNIKKIKAELELKKTAIGEGDEE